MVGKWLFRLENSLGKRNARQECIKWFKAQPDPRFYTEYLEPCPCSFRQASWDERFTVRDWQRLCGYAQFPSPDGWGQECCYSSDRDSRGALLVGNPGGGSAHRYHKLTQKWSTKHDSSDVMGYQKCCVNTDMCDLYYKRRPSDDCRNYVVPEWSKSFYNCCTGVTYSPTSHYGHFFNTDTSLLRTVQLVQKRPKLYKLHLNNTDTLPCAFGFLEIFLNTVH